MLERELYEWGMSNGKIRAFVKLCNRLLETGKYYRSEGEKMVYDLAVSGKTPQEARDILFPKKKDKVTIERE